MTDRTNSAAPTAEEQPLELPRLATVEDDYHRLNSTDGPSDIVIVIRERQLLQRERYRL